MVILGEIIWFLFVMFVIMPPVIAIILECFGKTIQGITSITDKFPNLWNWSIIVLSLCVLVDHYC